MRSEKQKEYDKNYRAKNRQLSITVSPEIMQLVTEAAARNGKSKAQYIVDLIKADNNIKYGSQ